MCPQVGSFAIQEEGEVQVSREGGLRGAEETGLPCCLVTGAKGREGRGWQVSDGLAPTCSLEGMETPT